MHRLILMVFLLFITTNSTHANPLELTTFLRSLRSTGVGSFPTLAHLRASEDNPAASIHFTIAGVTLQAFGDADTQIISQLHLAVVNPSDLRQNDRWISLIDGSLSILKPQSSAIERLMIIQRTVNQETYIWKDLQLSASWQEHGYTFIIHLN